MSDRIISDGVMVLTAIVGLAIIATLVSKNSSTSSVLTSGGSAFAAIISAATNPGGGNGLSIPSLSSAT